MKDIAIGSRFWFKDNLYEVKECKDENPCSSCAFDGYNGKYCGKLFCTEEKRHDKKSAYVKLIVNHFIEDM